MIDYTDMGFGIALCALILALSNIIFTLMDGHVGKPQNKVYLLIVTLLAINAACEVVNSILQPYVTTSDDVFFGFRVSQYIYFLTHTLLGPMFFFYVSFLTGRSVGVRLKRKYIGSTVNYILDTVPIAVVWVTEIFLALNPIFRWAWYYDEGRNFHRAWGEYLFVYIVSTLWQFLAFFISLRSWNVLSKSRKTSIAVSFLLVEAGVLSQLFFSSVRIEVFMEALGFTAVLLFIENEDDRRNVELDIYNPPAFSLDLSAVIQNNIPVKVLIIRDIRFNKTANTIVSGRIDRDVINKAVADFLASKTQRWFVYSIGHGRFAVLVYNQSKEGVRKFAEKIAERFDSTWKLDGADVFLSAKIMIVSVPERTNSMREVLYISECPIPDTMQGRIFEGSELDWIVRHAAVEAAVTRGLKENSFEVYYQPTFDIDKKLHGAEALLRMHDKELGMVFPDEFIPIAEQIGLIDELDDFVLREVCKFILTGVPQRNGIECINVNLSVLECMKDGFAEHVSDIVGEAGVKKKLINFEITESVAAKDYEHLSDVIDHLRNEGFRFSIDDYGTGYSNMTALFSLGADVIKIDKSVLWNVNKSDLGMTLLKTSIDMVHEMKKKALMEGVETEAQIGILKKLGCDYLQGYYFSKPLPKDMFVDYISSKAMMM